jgi:glyoxylase-like metal-dependent hydrolase (beta-lactamase superfamily II)
MARNAIGRTVGTNVYGMELEQIAPRLWHWTAPHPDWKPSARGKDGQGWDQMVSSYALVGDDAFVLIDPQVPEDSSDAARLWEALDSDVDAHGPPAIVISVYWHMRSAEDIADRYGGSSTWAPADAPKRMLERARGYDSGEELPAGIRVFDVGMPGERALYLPSHKAVVFGDAVLDGIRLLPDSWLDQDEAVPKGKTRGDVADALRALLDEDIELVLLTHGGPVSDTPREKLERALAPA